jgi:hypothetical protein
MGAGADQCRQGQEGQRSGFLGAEGARGVGAEAEQGLAGPAPTAPATIASVRGSTTPRGGYSRLEASAPQRSFLLFFSNLRSQSEQQQL